MEGERLRVSALKWNQMICRATDLCLIYRAGCRPDRHANKFQMRWRHKLDSAQRRNYKRGPTKLWHSKTKQLQRERESVSQRQRLLRWRELNTRQTTVREQADMLTNFLLAVGQDQRNRNWKTGATAAAANAGISRIRESISKRAGAREREQWKKQLNWHKRHKLEYVIFWIVHLSYSLKMLVKTLTEAGKNLINNK